MLYQQRGLPHVHILIILHQDDKIRNTDQIDQHISAEIPNKEEDEELYNLVTKQMIHGPCGNINPYCACMISGKCKGNFPQPYREITEMGNDSYALYRRRNNGVTFTKFARVNRHLTEVTFDNRDVVAYSPTLLKFIKAHCNVEVCATVKAVKYMYKYVHKGPDRAEVHATTDEIERYVQGRYLGPCEACHRIFGFPIHYNGPSVVRLQVHFKYKQPINFAPIRGRDALQEMANGPPPETTLTAWFKKNQENDGLSRTLLYYEMPEKYTWNETDKVWKKRKNKQFAVGRMYWVTPKAGELYYLRVLLIHVKGATSYEDLRTANGVTYNTYQEACLHRGYLLDDNEAVNCMNEAVNDQMPSALRNLFATILIYNNPSNPLALWNQFKEHLSEDIMHKNNERVLLPETENECLLLLQDILQRNGKTLQDYSLPTPIARQRRNRYIAEERSYNIQDMQDYVSNNYDHGTLEQRDIFDRVMAAEREVRNNRNTSDHANVFFIDACAGSGKSWTINLILAAVRAEGGIALATATSGIAALLLKGGSTAHSTFKIPINVTEDSTCSISKQSDLAALLKVSSLIIWDEVTMSHKHGIEAVDRLLRDLMSSPGYKCDIPFGGKVVIFSGDFRQCLPIIPMGNEAASVGASMKGSYIWDCVQKLQLTQNMRVLIESNAENASRQQSWADWLLSIGNGSQSNPINLDVQDIHHCDDIDHLINCVYGDTADYSKRAIVTGLRSDVEMINNKMLQRNESVVHDYMSIDTPQLEEDEQNATTLLPEEFLNTLTPQGLPPHKLSLKVGCPILLLRNLNKSMGLANGTRLIVTELRPHTIKAEIVTQGAFYMTTVIIPRIDLVTDNKQLPFQFRRRQFPVQLAYSMTIHKSQGQSFERMGIYIDTPLFTHGQLYVALSRVGKAGGIFMHIVDKDQQKIKYTDNVIYHSALQSEGYRIITNSEETHRVENSSTREHRDTYDAASTSSDSDSDSDSEHSNSRELTAKQTSILNVKTYIRQYVFPHSITGSWAIIPFILDVFGIHHDRAQGIKFYSDIAHEGLYEKLKQITIKSFKERKVILRNLPWKRTANEPQYLDANVQENLLDFEFQDKDDTTTKNMGEVLESLLHDVINEISPPIAQTSV